MPENARYWILTIPALPGRDLSWVEANYKDNRGRTPAVWCIGQRERGASGYEHWQLVVCFAKVVRLAAIKKRFGKDCHAEPTRSAAASEYVQKDETSLGDRFEFGAKPFQRNEPADWERVFESAKSGRILEIPGDIRVRCFNQIVRIQSYYQQPGMRSLI